MPRAPTAGQDAALAYCRMCSLTTECVPLRRQVKTLLSQIEMLQQMNKVCPGLDESCSLRDSAQRMCLKRTHSIVEEAILS